MQMVLEAVLVVGRLAVVGQGGGGECEGPAAGAKKQASDRDAVFDWPSPNDDVLDSSAAPHPMLKDSSENSPSVVSLFRSGLTVSEGDSCSLSLAWWRVRVGARRRWRRVC
jgi:hypothetical protein